MRDLSRRVAVVALASLGVLSCGPAPGPPGEEAGAAGGPGGGTPGAPSGTPPPGGVRIVFVTHGQSADPFWSVVANGARAAAEDLGVRVEYQAPGSFDMVEMANLIEAAVASRPHGLVVSIPDADALGPWIRRAVASGIPVVSINSGAEVFRELGVLVHVGQPEYEAGYEAGRRLARAGVTRALCVNHEVGNVALDLRCRGLEDALGAVGGRVRVLAVDLADPDDTRERIAGALASDPRVDGILTLGPTGAEPALAALAGAGRAGSVVFATFDLSPRVLEGIRDGAVLFAVDQQPFLQGYLPVVILSLYRRTGTVPAPGGVIPTGPAFVTRETAAEVLRLVEEGLR